jgi:hypothetical protein
MLGLTGAASAAAEGSALAAGAAVGAPDAAGSGVVVGVSAPPQAALPTVTSMNVNRARGTARNDVMKDRLLSADEFRQGERSASVEAWSGSVKAGGAIVGEETGNRNVRRS